MAIYTFIILETSKLDHTVYCRLVYESAIVILNVYPFL